MWLMFCCKKKTAYEMRISDWSSDVCSSDLSQGLAAVLRQEAPHRTGDAGRSHRRLMRLDCIGGGWPTSAPSPFQTRIGVPDNDMRRDLVRSANRLIRRSSAARAQLMAGQGCAPVMFDKRS